MDQKTRQEEKNYLKAAAESTLKQIAESILRQRQDAHTKLCSDRKLPDFTSGQRCISCGQNIFRIYDGTTYITGCPYCHKSFCG
jgi:hypothetical protein